MKIIHLLQSPFFSGAENVVCQIMKMFISDDKIEMVYVSPNGPIKESIESKGFTYIGLDNFTVRYIRKVIKEQKPNIIHAHDISSSLLACLSTIGLNVQIISHVHVNNANMAKFNLKTLLYYISSFRYKHIFWVSPSCFESYRFQKGLAKKSSILCNVMDKEDIFIRASENKDTISYDIVYVGRLAYQKNPERLLKVLCKVIEKLPNIKIGIVGDGALLAQTKIQAESMELLNNIDFLGFQSNPLKILSKAKVMVMTSRYEGLPMTVLEALALGIPIVSTPVDGLLNVISNGQNGFLTENDDLFVEKVCSIVKDSSLRESLSINAKNRFDKICDLQKYKESISFVYNKK